MSGKDRIGLALAALVGAAGVALVVHQLARDEPAPEPRDEPAVARDDPSPVRREALGGAGPVSAPAGLPKALVERNNAAIEALDAGELARAVELFEACHAELPDEDVFRRNLAEALARLARQEHADLATRAQALEHLARAVELAPEREELARLLDDWRRAAEAEQGFWTDETEHFHLSFDGERSELLHRGTFQLQTALESAYFDLSELFGRSPVEEGRPKIQVVLYRRETFGELTGLGHWAGGVFDGTVRVPVEDFDAEKEQLESVLRHELLHAFVKEIGGARVPGWLNEGLAQWVETPYLDERAAKVQRARAKLEGHALFPLEKLRGSLASWDDAAQIELAYAQSLAFVEHLQRWKGERVLFDMVADHGRGKSAAQSFRERTGDELDAQLKDLADGL